MRSTRLPLTIPGRNRLPGLARSEREELLDEPERDSAELAHNLRDIRRVNRFFGGVSTTVHHARTLLEAMPAESPASVLDLATGSADIPLALARWAHANGRSVQIVASDVADDILNAARPLIAGRSEISLARYDARAVPLPDESVDIVLCSLALHHFSPADAVLVLREMERLARRGFVVNDLRRGRVGYAAAWLAARLTTTNRLTRHDAPLSVLRAYTPAELADLLRRANVQGAVVTTHPWFRMAAVKVKDRVDA